MDDLIMQTQKAAVVEQREDMNIVIVGHVDHGKSTIIGRLLADNHMLPEGKLEQIQEQCRRNAKPFEYAFLLDALKDEQSQGITIDTARVFFSTKKRNYIILDAPGHLEFLKNMVTGASRAEAALMVIDAQEGIMENSRRHSYLLAMLGVRQVAVLVNKMDLMEYSQKRFEEIVSEYSDFLTEINIQPRAFIPVSGAMGDNIVRHAADTMPWYEGKTVLEQLEAFQSIGNYSNLPLRMSVQDVYKFTEDHDNRRIIAGTIETGVLKVGQKVIFYPSGKSSTVKTIEAFNCDPPRQLSAGSAAGFTMTEQIYARRGDMIAVEGETPPIVSDQIRANVFWLGRSPLSTGKRYFIKLGTSKTGAKLTDVKSVLNAATLEKTKRDFIDRNEVGDCVFKLDAPIAFDCAEDNLATNRFVIVDNYEISGGGIIISSENTLGGGNIHPDNSLLAKEERMLSQRQKGTVLWFTGLSGSGKSTIGNALERRLNGAGYAVYRLDGDNLRFGLNQDCSFTPEGRRENIRRAYEVAKLFADAGVIVLCTFISPQADMRRQARSSIGEDFVEIYVKAPVEECMRRDPKGLYKKAMSGEIENFTGVNAPYEAPENPEITLDTTQISPEQSTELLMNYLQEHKILY